MLLKRKTYRDRWWQFTEPQIALFRRVRQLARVLAVSRVSKYFAFEFVRTDAVYSDKVVVFVSDKWEDFAVLNSSLHQCWALRYGATHGDGGTPNYKPTECGSTFPFPKSPLALAAIGEQYGALRRQMMIEMDEGLTKFYNRFHCQRETSRDLDRIRALQTQIDHELIAAYKWTIDLGHGFYETKHGIRYTISESARRDILARLLVLNHELYAQEQATLRSMTKPKYRLRSSSSTQPALF